MIQSGTKISQYHEQATWSSPLAIARIQEELRSVTSNGSIWEEQRYKRIEYLGNAFSLTVHPKREGWASACQCHDRSVKFRNSRSRQRLGWAGQVRTFDAPLPADHFKILTSSSAMTGTQRCSHKLPGE